MPTAVVMTVWCAAPAVSQRRPRWRSRAAGFQIARPTGSFGRSGGLDVLDDVRHQPEAVAHVAHRDDDGGAGVGREDEAHRVVLAADAERVDLEARPRGRQRRATSSMCAPRIRSSPGTRSYV